MATRHDKEVKKEIARLKRKGFVNIKADLPGYDKPNPIGQKGKVPDIEASKRGKRVIKEIEEEGQVMAQKEQMSTFRRHAGQNRGTEFELVTFKKRKKGVKRSS